MRPYRHGNHVRLLECGGEYFPALEQAIDEAREYRREAATRIVVPEAGGLPPMGPGKLKMP